VRHPVPESGEPAMTANRPVLGRFWSQSARLRNE
jgi:hypothetical protein